MASDSPSSKKLFSSENKAVKFLSGKVTEIIMLIISILVALQIDNIVAAKNAKSYVETTLGQVHQDLKNDLMVLDFCISNRKKSVDAMDKINELRTSSGQTDSLKYWTAAFMQFDRFKSINSSYSNIKSKGLDYLSNDTLRAGLSRYYDYEAGVLESMAKEIESEFMDVWLPYIEQYADDFEFAAKIDFINPRFPLDHPEVMRMIRIRRSNHAGTMAVYKQHRRNIVRLIHAIESELKIQAES